MNESVPNIFCVRADFGRYIDQFLRGGYAAIGWLADIDLAGVTEREQLYQLYTQQFPEEKNQNVIGQQVGQIARFLFEMKPGDLIVTPSSQPEDIYWGTLQDGELIYQPKSSDGCPFPYRRPVVWENTVLKRKDLSSNLRYTLGSSLTVFSVKHKADFFEAIGWQNGDVAPTEDYKTSVIQRILKLDAKEFEILVTELLRADGFIAEHKGKPGDKGVDVSGTLQIHKIAQVGLYIQVKRYNLSHKVSESEVIALRRNIPPYLRGAQGAFITTSDFEPSAIAASQEAGYIQINLVNGRDFVEWLSENWEELEQSEDAGLQNILEKLSLERGLRLK